jgi:hypothetical protein
VLKAHEAASCHIDGRDGGGSERCRMMYKSEIARAIFGERPLMTGEDMSLRRASSKLYDAKRIGCRGKLWTVNRQWLEEVKANNSEGLTTRSARKAQVEART